MSSHLVSSKDGTLIPQEKKKVRKTAKGVVIKAFQTNREEMQTSFRTPAKEPTENKAVPAQENPSLGDLDMFCSVFCSFFLWSRDGTFFFLFCIYVKVLFIKKHFKVPTTCQALCQALMLQIWILISLCSEGSPRGGWSKWWNKQK